METLTDLITNFGDVIELSLPQWDLNRTRTILEKHNGWAQYNSRKPNINRKGLSVTSLDGGFGGVPDLDSLREYNKINNTNFVEEEFKNRTNIVNFIPELNKMLDLFPDHGRCHFLRLDSGGFFPPHRDNGIAGSLPRTFRIIVPINNFNKYQMSWLHDGVPLYLEEGRTYFINTTKIHSLFSFVDNCSCFVMNILVSDRSIQTILKHLMIS